MNRTGFIDRWGGLELVQAEQRTRDPIMVGVVLTGNGTTLPTILGLTVHVSGRWVLALAGIALHEGQVNT